MEVEGLVRAAAAGDAQAWNGLVERFARLVWAVVRTYRVQDADDVVQTVWLRAVEHLGSVREPDRFGAWLATTARRECLRAIRIGGRFRPAAEDDDDLDWIPDPAGDAPTEQALQHERDGALWEAVRALREPCDALLRLLSTDPAPSYEEIAAALDRPIGWIGPTRGRCLEKLRERLRITGWSEELS